MAEMERQHSASSALADSAMSDDKVRALIAEVLKNTVQGSEDKRRDAETLASVKFGAEGLEASDLGGLWRLANMYSRSTIVPEHYRGNPENCLIALQMSKRCGIDPFAFMQSSYIVYGKPGIEGKLAIAMLNTSGKIRGRIRFDFSADRKACTATVTDKESGAEIAMTIDWKLVEAEKWHEPKKSQPSKWMTMPDQMFRYRSAVFLIRAHYPEVLMGLQTKEELEDSGPEKKDADEATTGGARAALEKLNGQENGKSQVPTAIQERMEAPAPSAPSAPKKQEQSPVPPENQDADDPPMSNEQDMLIADELIRTGQRQDWVAAQVQAAGRKRYKDLSSAEAEGMLAELKDMPDKDATLPMQGAKKPARV